MPHTPDQHQWRFVFVLAGDLFSSDAQTFVNTVNCVGVMGKGIALEFKRRFPEMFDDYAVPCRKRQVKLGEPYLYRRLLPPWILNFPTKDDWRSVSKLSNIVAGLNRIIRHYSDWGITSLAVPPLGCGNGQLEWYVVGPTLFRNLSRLEIPVQLFAPYGTPSEQLDPSFLGHSQNGSVPISKINPAWIALVEILARISREPYHWPLGRVAFQKIAYFATQAGIPTGLDFVRGSFGPFAPGLKRLVAQLQNNGLLREQRAGRMFVLLPGLTYADAMRTYGSSIRRWANEIDRITDLFLRMQTSQAEVAATVHFVARSIQESTGHQPHEIEVFDEVRHWKQRRRPPLQDEEIAQTVRNLGGLKWLHLRPSAELPVTEDHF